MPFILGKKIKMSQIFDERGEVVPITLIQAGPCFITQIKTNDKDGYQSVQIGFEKLKDKKAKKSMEGKEFKYIREFRLPTAKRTSSVESKTRRKKKNFSSPSSSPFAVAQVIGVSIFKEGDKVKVSGISKGKGFQGAVKRWGFSGMGASHGVKHEHRTLGSVGSTDAARVFKGKKMPGRMGYQRVTKKNLKVVKIDIENNLIAVKGAVPGRHGTLLEITSG